MTGLIIDKLGNLLIVEVNDTLYGVSNADIKNSVFRELKIGSEIWYDVKSQWEEVEQVGIERDEITYNFKYPF